MMEQPDKHMQVVLASNASGLFKGNTPSSFKTELERSVRFNSTWEVALAKIIFCNNVFNITSDCNRLVISTTSYVEKNQETVEEPAPPPASNDESDGKRKRDQTDTIDEEIIHSKKIRREEEKDETDAIDEIYNSRKKRSERDPGKEYETVIDKWDLIIPPGRYTPASLVNELNKQSNIVSDAKFTSGFRRESETNKLNIVLRPDDGIYFPESRIRDILGFDIEHDLSYIRYVEKEVGYVNVISLSNPIDLETITSKMYVYCSCAKTSFVGNTMAPIIDIVTLNNHPSTNYTTVVNNPLIFYDLNSRLLEQIEIECRDAYGNLIQFPRNCTTELVLTFRNPDMIPWIWVKHLLPEGIF